jgi:hypothetical protein
MPATPTSSARPSTPHAASEPCAVRQGAVAGLCPIRFAHSSAADSEARSCRCACLSYRWPSSLVARGRRGVFPPSRRFPALSDPARHQRQKKRSQ